MVAAVGLLLAGLFAGHTQGSSWVNADPVDSAVSAASGAIRTAHYAAVMRGHAYAVSFDPATSTYQVSCKANGSTEFSNVEGPVSLGQGVTIGQPTSLVFLPSGEVQSSSGKRTVLIRSSQTQKILEVSIAGRVTVIP